MNKIYLFIYIRMATVPVAPVPAQATTVAPAQAQAPTVAPAPVNVGADLEQIRSNPKFRLPIIKANSDIMPEEIKTQLYKAITAVDSDTVLNICKEWAGNKETKDIKLFDKVFMFSSKLLLNESNPTIINAYKKRIDIVKILIAAGADVNATVGKDGPLLFIATKTLDSEDIIKHIIEAGAIYTKELTGGTFKDPLLAYSIDNSCFNVAKYLISREPNFIDQQDHNGNYLLQLANKKLTSLKGMVGKVGVSLDAEIAGLNSLIEILGAKGAPRGWLGGVTKKRRCKRGSRRNKRTGRCKKGEKKRRFS